MGTVGFDGSLVVNLRNVRFDSPPIGNVNDVGFYSPPIGNVSTVGFGSPPIGNVKGLGFSRTPDYGRRDFNASSQMSTHPQMLKTTQLGHGSEQASFDRSMFSGS
jgi:hypothetical protein